MLSLLKKFLENGYQNKLVSMNQRHTGDKCGMIADGYCVRMLLGSNPSLSFQDEGI
jgi:hypothetical protein